MDVMDALLFLYWNLNQKVDKSTFYYGNEDVVHFNCTLQTKIITLSFPHSAGQFEQHKGPLSTQKNQTHIQTPTHSSADT